MVEVGMKVKTCAACACRTARNYISISNATSKLGAECVSAPDDA